MAEPIRDAASATTYRGFSAVDAHRGSRAPDQTPPARRAGVAALALATAAIAAGLAWFLTDASGERQLRPRPAPVPAPTSLRADPVLAPAPVQRVLPVERTPEPAVAHPAIRKPLPVTNAAAPARAAFHCDWRLRPSERMICGSARLSQLDHQLNHVYGQAVAAGVPRARLRRDQDAWVFRREAAARSPTTLEAYYVRRIRELQAMAARPATRPAARHATRPAARHARHHRR